MEPLNWDTLRQNCGGDEALVKEVLGLFRAEAEGLLRDVENAVASADSQALKRTAHRLKGALVSLAAGPTTDCARALEVCGGSGPIDQAPALFAQLKLEMSRLLREIALPQAA
jgi:HPt (histidine-containing phosphotransfer) domain-containing protein